MQNKNKHTPVLLAQTLQYLDPKPGDTYLDLTAGYGGHAAAVLERTKGQALLVDRDEVALSHLKELFRDKAVDIQQQDFLGVSQDLLAANRQFDIILADLGMSSPHLNTASRGFAIKHDGPLDMRMDQRQPLTAGAIVNSYSEAQLAELIRRYGEEYKANKIAWAITHSRPIDTTTQLANIIAKVKPRSGKIHPATKTFQALRIVVNDELNQLERALPIWIDLLAPGGRLAVISFHSLEDRMVKEAFKEAGSEGYDARLQILTKKSVSSDKNEIDFNPRARSAKLRAAVKIKTNRKGA